MSLLLLLWLVAAFAACGFGAWLAMAGVILGGMAHEFVASAGTLRVYVLSGAICAGFGLLLFVVGVGMIARVLG
ncbi:hypothetical protein AWL63_06130 [Sphingomonas panacis]|uniref:Uncharacterized protein n=1 Tax=Sphingomonas panacis TaxID=1560345 RepID=A0A1B3Z855_9SPHN|nr:hypothetical protein [Sphingomonas panacis]AOH83612.1 hypothetical protein AWL63_06130 [Sphingomonas panacis]